MTVSMEVSPEVISALNEWLLNSSPTDKRYADVARFLDRAHGSE